MNEQELREQIAKEIEFRISKYQDYVRMEIWQQNRSESAFQEGLIEAAAIARGQK
jgi:hypothetical protein